MKFKKIVQTEQSLRKKKETYFVNRKIPFFHLKILPNDSYNNYECDICTSYGFFSFMICINCNSKLCLSHSNCGCAKPMIQLMYRDLLID